MSEQLNQGQPESTPRQLVERLRYNKINEDVFSMLSRHSDEMVQSGIMERYVRALTSTHSEPELEYLSDVSRRLFGPRRYRTMDALRIREQQNLADNLAQLGNESPLLVYKEMGSELDDSTKSTQGYELLKVDPNTGEPVIGSGVGIRIYGKDVSYEAGLLKALYFVVDDQTILERHYQEQTALGIVLIS